MLSFSKLRHSCTIFSFVKEESGSIKKKEYCQLIHTSSSICFVSALECRKMLINFAMSLRHSQNMLNVCTAPPSNLYFHVYMALIWYLFAILSFSHQKTKKIQALIKNLFAWFFFLQTRRQNQFPAYIDRNDWDYFPLLMACKHKPWRNKLMWKWRYDCVEAVLSCP